MWDDVAWFDITREYQHALHSPSGPAVVSRVPKGCFLPSLPAKCQVACHSQGPHEVPFQLLLFCSRSTPPHLLAAERLDGPEQQFPHQRCRPRVIKSISRKKKKILCFLWAEPHHLVVILNMLHNFWSSCTISRLAQIWFCHYFVLDLWGTTPAIPSVHVPLCLQHSSLLLPLDQWKLPQM